MLYISDIPVLRLHLLFVPLFRSLDGVPVAFKKAAVVELKTVLNTIATKKPEASEPKTSTIPPTNSTQVI